MYTALYDFFFNIVFNQLNGSELKGFFLGISGYFDETNGILAYVSLQQYLSFLCSTISLIFILVLCCLFIYRLIRLVGRLFSGGAL